MTPEVVEIEPNIITSKLSSLSAHSIILKLN